MATFIKAGFWKEICRPCNGYKDWLNLDKFVDDKVAQETARPQGSFYSTQNQTGNAGAVLTMSLNVSDPWNNDVLLVSGTQITLAKVGVYNIQFSAQMVKETGNSATHSHIWLSQNGIDVPHSASQISFPSNSVYVVAAWNWFFETTSPNEHVELKWEINSNVNDAVVIEARNAVGNVPAIPSLIVTVNQVGG